MVRYVLILVLAMIACNNNSQKNGKVLSPNMLSPNHKNDSATIYYEYFHRKITDLYKLEKIKEVDYLADSLINKYPNDGYGYFEKGFIEGYNKNFAIAISFFNKAEKLNFKKELCKKQVELFTRLMRLTDSLNVKYPTGRSLQLRPNTN